MRLVLFVIAGLPACGNAGTPPPPPDQLLTVNPNTFEVTVDDGPMQYAMHFHDGALKLPDRLSIGNIDNVLGIDTDPCNKESQIGLAVFPAVVATANTEAQGAMSMIDVPFVHPAIATVHVSYDVPYQCPAEQHLIGDTFFTFYASGRIVRHDTAVPSQMPLTVPTSPATQNCGCLSGANAADQQTANDTFFFTSYWAFEAATPPGVDGAGNPTSGGLPGACTITPGYSVGVNWSRNATRIGPNSQAAHVFDFQSSVGTLTTDVGDVFSAIQIDPTMNRPADACGAILEQLDERLLFIAGVDHTTDDDGIYRDGLEHPDGLDLAAGDQFVPAGFAVTLDLGGADHARITSSQDGFAQPIVARESPNSDRFVFYFPDALMPRQTVTIETL